MPIPGVGMVVTIAAVAIVLSATLGSVAVRRIATRPAAELVRGE